MRNATLHCAIREAAAAQQQAAEQLMKTATAKLADATAKLKEARELREAVSAGFERQAAEAAAVPMPRRPRERWSVPPQFSFSQR